MDAKGLGASLANALLGGEIGRRYDEAMAHYREAGKAYTGYWLVDEHMAELLAATRKFDEAATLYESVIARAPLPELYQRLGVTSPGPDLGLLDAHHHAPTPLLVLRGHTAAVRAVAFLHDGKQVISGSDDGTVRIGRSSGEEPHLFLGHDGKVRTVAFSPDGRWLASGGADRTIRLWPIPDVSKTLPLILDKSPTKQSCDAVGRISRQPFQVGLTIQYRHDRV